MRNLKYIPAFLLLGFAMPGFATGIEDLINNSEGYVGIRPNVLLVENEDDVRICHFDISEAFFKSYGENGSASDAAKPDIACAPIRTFAVSQASPDVNGPLDLEYLVDNSIGFVTIAPNILLIEGESSNEVCHFDMDEAYFTAIRAENVDDMLANQPVVTCVPFREIDN